MNFYETITDAVNDVAERGYQSNKQIEDWLTKIRRAALASLAPMALVERDVKSVLTETYDRMVTRGQILQFHEGISKYQAELVKPKLRAELERRIMANTQLVTMNRQEAIQRVERRFAAWATSVPYGGTPESKREVKKAIRKSLANLPFEDRRVAIDQGAKFIAALNDVLARDRNALAAMWHSRWRRPGYNYREDHKERDEVVYVIRGNWALNDGLMKVGPAGYTDQITQPAEEPYCSCSYRYIYNLTALPASLVTAKGLKMINLQMSALHE